MRDLRETGRRRLNIKRHTRRHAENFGDIGGYLIMDALKKFLVLISVIIGLSAPAAFAEEEADVVFGPQAASTVIEQVDESQAAHPSCLSTPCYL